MAEKLTTPPVGETRVETGWVGSVVVDGPSTVAGVVVVQIGLTSAAVGAAGLPAICGGEAVAWAVPSTVAPAITAVARAMLPIAFPRLSALPFSKSPARFIRSRSADRLVT